MTNLLLDREWTIGRALDSIEQRFFRSQGYVQLDSVWSASFGEALQREAAQIWRTRVADAPLLGHLHVSLMDLAREVSGCDVAADHAAYRFYDADDGVALHADGDPADVTFLSTVLGAVGPLHVVLDEDEDGDGCDGIPLSHPRLGVTAHRGDIRHHRPGRAVTRLSAVAVLRYREIDLLAEPDWPTVH
jgi:hypothetical protein